MKILNKMMVVVSAIAISLSSIGFTEVNDDHFDSRNPIDFFSSKLNFSERDSIEKYLNDFPFSNYQIYKVPSLGSFYLDNIDDSIKNLLKRGFKWEEDIINILQQYTKPNSLVLDIGAHIGTHTFSMACAVKKNGLVLAFEPQMKLFRELYMNLSINRFHNIQIFRYAIGDSNKIVQMGLCGHRNEGGTGIGNGGDDVEMKTLDSFNLSNVSCIKIDVEGYEDAVLEGAKETIMRNRPVIVIEIMGGCDFDNTTPEIREKIIHTQDKIKSFNYSITRIGIHDYLGIPNNM